MYEPHLYDHTSDTIQDGDGSSLLAELDKIGPIKAFDAFPKVEIANLIKCSSSGSIHIYFAITQRRSLNSGGWVDHLFTSLGEWDDCARCTLIMVQNDLGEYLYGAPDYSFRVDHQLEKDLQLNVDLTVAMPCRGTP